MLKEGIESAFEEHGIPSLYSSTPDLDQATPGWTLPKACGVVGLGLGWAKKIGFLSCSFLYLWTDLLQKVGRLPKNTPGGCHKRNQHEETFGDKVSRFASTTKMVELFVRH